MERVFAPTRRPAVLRPVGWLSHAGDGGAVWILFYAWRFRHRPAAGLRGLVALAVMTVLVNGPVKSRVDRERPEPLAAVKHRPPGSSFPSGHAFSSCLMAAMLPDRGSRIAAGALAAPIAASRVQLRYHHCSDVVAGAALGLAAGRVLRRLLT
jgi:undecaprenyl-diphosphatase